MYAAEAFCPIRTHRISAIEFISTERWTSQNMKLYLWSAVVQYHWRGRILCTEHMLFSYIPYSVMEPIRTFCSEKQNFINPFHQLKSFLIRICILLDPLYACIFTTSSLLVTRNISLCSIALWRLYTTKSICYYNERFTGALHLSVLNTILIFSIDLSFSLISTKHIMIFCNIQI